MTKARQRVIALDYLRGICILAVILNHAYFFTIPFAYIGGNGGLWTTAAELFVLLSGITYGVVRAEKVKTDFRWVIKKTWRRAGIIYAVNILIVFLSLFLALLLTSHRLFYDGPGELPTQSGFSLIWSVLNFSYSIGWATFLMYYSVFLFFAPFVQRLLNTRYWLLMPVLSAGLYLANSGHSQPLKFHSTFFIWQIYFVIGLVIAKFRPVVIPWFNKLSARTYRLISSSVFTITLASIILASLLNFRIYPYFYEFTAKGWLPIKSLQAYQHLIGHDAALINNLFMDGRTGTLRPLIALAFLTSGYLLYQKHKDFLLKRTGKVVILMGENSLWLFAGQALVIPLLAALPIHRTLFNNFILTMTLMFTMWAIAKRKHLMLRARNYSLLLAQSFSESKYAAMYSQEDLS